MEKQCRHCGRQLPETGDLFCPSCRKPLIEFAAPTAPPLEEAPPPSFDEENLRKDHPLALQVAAISSVMFLALFWGLSFDPEIQARLARAFGEQLLRISPLVFSLLLSTLLFIPIPFCFYHYAILMRQAMRDGLSPLGLSGMLYVFDADQLHPHLRRSKLACLGGVLYFVVVCGAWIVYATMSGVFK